MNDYTYTINALLGSKYLLYKERASDPLLNEHNRQLYASFVDTRETMIIDLANKVIKENEKYYGIY